MKSIIRKAFENQRKLESRRNTRYVFRAESLKGMGEDEEKHLKHIQDGTGKK